MPENALGRLPNTPALPDWTAVPNTLRPGESPRDGKSVITLRDDGDETGESDDGAGGVDGRAEELDAMGDPEVEDDLP